MRCVFLTLALTLRKQTTSKWHRKVYKPLLPSCGSEGYHHWSSSCRRLASVAGSRRQLSFAQPGRSFFWSAHDFNVVGPLSPGCPSRVNSAHSSQRAGTPLPNDIPVLQKAQDRACRTSRNPICPGGNGFHVTIQALRGKYFTDRELHGEILIRFQGLSLSFHYSQPIINYHLLRQHNYFSIIYCHI